MKSNKYRKKWKRETEIEVNYDHHLRGHFYYTIWLKKEVYLSIWFVSVSNHSKRLF